MGPCEDGDMPPPLSFRAALFMFSTRLRRLFLRLRRHPRAIPALLVGTSIAATVMALQLVVSPTFGFIALVAGGLALGFVCGNLRDAVLAGFLMGYVAFFAGSVALGAWYEITVPAAFPGSSLLGGLFVGAVFGVFAGVWSAGAAALGGIVRRRPHAGHVL